MPPRHFVPGPPGLASRGGWRSLAGRRWRPGLHCGWSCDGPSRGWGGLDREIWTGGATDDEAAHEEHLLDGCGRFLDPADEELHRLGTHPIRWLTHDRQGRRQQLRGREVVESDER